MVFEENVKIPEYKWDTENIIHFDVSINDTVSSHNIYVNIRNSAKYEYSNLYLFIETKAPNGNSLKDTFEITLADHYGKWYGRGAGSAYSLQTPFKTNIRFPYRGIYSFDIEQAMWDKELPGITDVGLRIEKQ
jgi:gliding motility-associated lipoprotein GldH